jgi:hypothetical protein
MRKLFLTFAALVILFAGCKKEVWEKDSKIIDDKYVVFDGQNCPIVDLIINDDESAYLVKRIDGQKLNTELVKIGDGYGIIQGKGVSHFGLSCHCTCCGCRYSTRYDDVPFTNCLQCPNGWGGCNGELQHPFFHFPCDCGSCVIFIIEEL